MRISFVFIMALFISVVAKADSDSLQAELQSEYGNCYGKFADNLQNCSPSSCTYPDLTDAKSWKAQVINGIVNNTCYVMYYSYIGQNITTDPEHCFYDKDQQALLTQLYRKLFSAGTSVDILSIKEKIQYITYANCKTRDAAKAPAK